MQKQRIIVTSPYRNNWHNRLVQHRKQLHPDVIASSIIAAAILLLTLHRFVHETRFIRQQENLQKQQGHPQIQSHGSSISSTLLSSSSSSCALLFFGLGRQFRKVAFPSIQKHILDANPTCDVFVHTYQVSNEFGNRFNNQDEESGKIHPEELKLLLNANAHGDVENENNDNHIMFESEQDFQRKRNVQFYRTLFPRPSGECSRF